MLFRQLEYLVALSRERHFARAAQACYISQPALSEGIRKLEEELDVPLVRRGRTFEGLTPEGQRIVVWAQRILADRDALRDEAGALRNGLAGVLRIGTVPTASTVVSLLSAPFCTAHPLAHVRVSADLRSTDILRRLQDFDLDAGLTYLADVPDHFQSVPLYQERYVLLTSTAAGEDWPNGMPWQEAARLPLCMLETGMQGRRVLDEVFASAGVEVRPRVETDSIASLYAHVGTGRWAAVVPHAWLLVFGVPPQMRVVPLVEPVLSVPVGIVLTTREPGSVMARALAETAKEVDVTAALQRLPGRAAV